MKLLCKIIFLFLFSISCYSQPIGEVKVYNNYPEMVESDTLTNNVFWVFTTFNKTIWNTPECLVRFINRTDKKIIEYELITNEETTGVCCDEKLPRGKWFIEIRNINGNYLGRSKVFVIK